MKQYHKNYGFELENTLSKYPIKELMNQQYKDSMIESLQRGNLQKVTFVGKDGSEEKLFISPNISLGALNVYDQNKQRLTTEQIVVKEYIGKELAADLIRRTGQVQIQEPKETSDVKEAQKQSQHAKHAQKQETDKPAKKKSRKQKLR